MNDKIAIYLRLSLADGDLKKGSKDESNSIENQRMLLHDYIGKQEDLFGEIVEYVDEEIRALTKQASEKTYIGGLTKECVDAFVSMVYLYDDQTMKIEFNCEDVIRRALEKYGA